MQELESDKVIIENFKTHIKTNAGSNKTYTYILPMLQNEVMKYSTDYCNNNFRACFLGDITKKKDLTDNKILLLYKFHGGKPYLDFENKLINHPLFEVLYEPDKLHTMYVFKVPEKYKIEYNLFKDWKISKFNSEYKKLIQQFHKLESTHSVIQVLNKDKTLKKKLELSLNHRIPDENELSSSPVWFIEYYQKEFNMKSPRQKMENITNEFEV